MQGYDDMYDMFDMTYDDPFMVSQDPYMTAQNMPEHTTPPTAMPGRTPSIPMPNMPSTPNMPGMPGMPSMPGMPGTPAPGRGMPNPPGRGMPQEQMGRAGMEPYIYPQNMLAALKAIQDAVAGETEDRMFYQYLIDNATSAEDKEIITGIRDDEISHFSLFRNLYFQLTRQTLPPPQNVTFEKPASYCQGLAKALKGEQNAVRKYRQILYALQNRIDINVITGIITDEIRHGSLYNYLYTKNGCRG